MGSAGLKWCQFVVYVWVILGIAINYLVQLKFIYYHRSGNNNICQGVCKFGIICKWKICCIWDNGKDFGNLEESLCQGSLFDTKTWTCYWKGVFAPMLWQQIFSCFIVWFSEDIKNKCPIRKTFYCCVWSIRFLKPSYLQKVKLWKKKFSWKFLYQIASLGTGTLQSCQSHEGHSNQNQQRSRIDVFKSSSNFYHLLVSVREVFPENISFIAQFSLTLWLFKVLGIVLKFTVCKFLWFSGTPPFR